MLLPFTTFKWLLIVSIIGCFTEMVAVEDVTEQVQPVAAPSTASALAQPPEGLQQPRPLSEQNLAQQQQQQQNDHNFEGPIGNESALGSAGGRALAAPLLRGQQQTQAENAVEVNGERKPFFKIHYRDGVQKAVFDETPRRVPADFEDTNSVATGGDFDAYDDSRLVDPQLEQPLFIPEIYRNETREETKTAPPKGKGGTNRPLVSPELQSRQPITIRTTTARAGAVTAPPPVPFVRPAQSFGPPPASPVSPQRPKAPPGSAQPSRPLPQPPLPQQPFRPPNSQPPLQPPRPPPTPNAARPPTPNQQQRPLTPNAGGGQLRNGMCHQAIFYTPQTVNELDLQRVYTHFALVVSIDQCARTCHEFNCDVAILDPISRHCQFNPSTAFRIHPACPQWPNPLYRNNVRLGQDHIRIACVTCQQRRRIPRPGQNSPMPFNGQGKQQQQTSSVRRPATGGAPPAPPQHVIRTTGRDRLNAGPALLNGENSPLRIANAAALLQAAGISDDNEAGRDLSAEFHKLERLLKSAEDYLDDSEPQGERQLPADGGRTKPTVGKEVPSWQEGHPQGEGFSPLRINPLRRPYMEDPSRPHAIFFSTDNMQRQKVAESERKAEHRQDEFVQRRVRRDGAAGRGERPPAMALLA